MLSKFTQSKLLKNGLKQQVLLNNHHLLLSLNYLETITTSNTTKVSNTLSILEDILLLIQIDNKMKMLLVKEYWIIMTTISNTWTWKSFKQQQDADHFLRRMKLMHRHNKSSLKLLSFMIILQMEILLSKLSLTRASCTKATNSMISPSFILETQLSSTNVMV